MTRSLPMELFEPLQASPEYRIAAIVEMSRLEVPARATLLAKYGEHAVPLLLQPEFANLRDHGAWLFNPPPASTTHGQREFMQSISHSAGEAACGWLVSRLQPTELSEHLACANNVTGPDGREFLLRQHTEDAVRTLHARRELPGVRSWLMPLHSWWIPLARHSSNCWERLPGFDQPHLREPFTLEVDPQCWAALQGDPLRGHMAEQLEVLLAGAGQASRSHAMRTAQAGHFLAEGRRVGLASQSDLATYTGLMCLYGDALESLPLWQDALSDARDGVSPLNEAWQRRANRSA